ncbi:MAG: anti-phage ZorAB system protein ZorA [Actinomycetaceae bacterium]
MFPLIWPDFGALFRGELAGLNAAVILLILLIAGLFLYFFVRECVRANRTINQVHGIYKDIERDHLLANRQAMRQTADQSGGTPAHLWREFDETLVASPDGRRLWNTLDAEHFFNTRSLAPGLIHNPLLSAVPSILTAIGVLGTFLGLTTGLESLDLQGSEVDELRSGIDGLIQGASTAFMTSVWGVALSLVATGILKMAERAVAGKVVGLQDSIDATFLRHAPEQSLVEIMHSSDQTEKAMQELHEKIGSKLQEAVEGISTELQTALGQAISTAMAPSMEKLAESTQNQSAEVLKALVEQFTESVGDAGRQHRDALEDVTAALASVVEKLRAGIDEERELMATQTKIHRDQLNDMGGMLQRQSELIVTALEPAVEAFSTSAEHMSGSTSSLEASANKLEGMSEQIGRSSEHFAGALEGAHESLVNVSSTQVEVARLLGEQVESIEASGAVSKEVAAGLQGMADTQSEGFEKLRATQEEFLEGLRAKVGELDEQMSAWLAAYAVKVTDQTEDRMQVWNTQTFQFTSNMVQAAEGIQGAVGELGEAFNDKLDSRFEELVAATAKRLDDLRESGNESADRVVRALGALAVERSQNGATEAVSSATE